MAKIPPPGFVHPATRARLLAQQDIYQMSRISSHKRRGKQQLREPLENTLSEQKPDPTPPAATSVSSRTFTFSLGGSSSSGSTGKHASATRRSSRIAKPSRKRQTSLLSHEIKPADDDDDDDVTTVQNSAVMDSVGHALIDIGNLWIDRSTSLTNAQMQQCLDFAFPSLIGMPVDGNNLISIARKMLAHMSSVIEYDPAGMNPLDSK